MFEKQLLIAAQFGYYQFVKYLIKMGANVNCRDKFGECTPLLLGMVSHKTLISKIYG